MAKIAHPYYLGKWPFWDLFSWAKSLRGHPKYICSSNRYLIAMNFWTDKWIWLCWMLRFHTLWWGWGVNNWNSTVQRPWGAAYPPPFNSSMTRNKLLSPSPLYLNDSQTNAGNGILFSNKSWGGTLSIKQAQAGWPWGNMWGLESLKLPPALPAATCLGAPHTFPRVSRDTVWASAHTHTHMQDEWRERKWMKVFTLYSFPET